MKEFLRKLHLYRIARSIYIWGRNTFMPLGYIRNYFVFPIKAYVRTHSKRIMSKHYRYLNECKDKYTGERCFIIATGPSLRLSDVERLKEEYTFAVNSFFKIYDKTDFRPTFYVTLDPDSVRNFEEMGGFCPENYSTEQSFLNDIFKDKKKYKNNSFVPYCYLNHWFGLGQAGFDYAKNLKWTEDVRWGIFDKYTVTIAVMDLAIYMGFKEIYLLGVDCNYTGEKVYFVNPGDNYEMKSANMKLATQEAMMTGYEFMAREASKRGIKIYNATRGGMLEKFPRINFDNLMNKKCGKS